MSSEGDTVANRAQGRRTGVKMKLTLSKVTSTLLPTVVLAALTTGLLVVGLPTASAQAARVQEVEINLKKYCSSRKLVFAGWSKKRKSFVCGEQHTGFNTYYLKNFSKINLTSVCRTLAGTTKWRYQGKRAWCLKPAAHLINFRMCNRKNEPVWSTMASYQHKKSKSSKGRRRQPTGWVSQGWWKIAPGKCRTLWTNVEYKGDIYVHGRTASRTITGSDARFCVNNATSYKMGQADKIACKGGKLKKIGMSKLTTRGGMNTWNFR